MEEVVLVNKNDEPIGTMEKMEAHEKGLLHRAFSVFVFNDNQELMLQKRARSKYHSGGLWTNTCCSHPRPDESIEDAAVRRLMEEMGFKTEVQSHYHFIYKTALDNDLVEHELDYVLTGIYNSVPNLNEEEAEDYKFVALPVLEQWMQDKPEDFTVWFKIAYPELKKRMGY